MHAGHGTAIFFTQLLLLVLAGRLLGEVMQRLRQPAVMGQLLAGVLLGPSIFGALLPAWQHAVFPDNETQKKMLDAVSELGVLLLLLSTGLETDLGLVRRMKRMAIFASAGGMILPFVCGFALGWHLPDALLPHPEARLVTSLFLGTALSISSVKVVAMVIREVDYLRRNIGQIILAAAILDDTTGWIIIAAIAGLGASGSIDVGHLSFSLGGTVLFIALCFTVGKRAVAVAIRWTNDRFTIEMPVLSAILVITFVLALATDKLGVHTALGAFMAGVMIGQSPILTEQIEAQLRGLIVALFAPVFFGVAGLSVDLTILLDWRMLGLVAGLILIASVGKFTGCFVGGRLGGMSGAEALALATGMNARGSTEIIVASIGLSLGVLSKDLFTMIVIMALITTLIMPPVLRRALVRIPLSEQEKARLEKEAAEERDFLPHVERILAAVDGSANGRFAAWIAGLTAGVRGTLTTVLAPTPAETDGGRTAREVSEAVDNETASGPRRHGGSGEAAREEGEHGKAGGAGGADEEGAGRDAYEIALAAARLALPRAPGTPGVEEDKPRDDAREAARLVLRERTGKPPPKSPELPHGPVKEVEDIEANAEGKTSGASNGASKGASNGGSRGDGKDAGEKSDHEKHGKNRKDRGERRDGGGADHAPRLEPVGEAHDDKRVSQARHEGEFVMSDPSDAAREQKASQPENSHEATRISDEIAKGYGFVIAGFDAPGQESESDVPPLPLPTGVLPLTKAFDGAIAIVLAHGEHARQPDAPLDILVPVSGTDYSRHAAELAITLARAANAPVTALHVSARAAPGMLHRRWRPRALRPDAAQAAMLENLHALAERNGVSLRTRLLAGGKVEDAVLHQIGHGKHNLLVLGVQPRFGDRLNFGSISHRLLEERRCSVIVLSA
ncbi:cation:proton antiporter [Pandoraea nosoerga]|uniref:Na(+)/H(+)-K(+) antiporter GerN n=1 Tax=Pandoraea nosoerga TaxID=2508296 RepID=A0A5E4V516_9BURK|nr:cation:proton antiporter [Pandoraea nosoerga]MBN4667869.1 cation:proton antiporter [Pandoraea nosoerga]MBN4676526.1 cation:proton antiporter [Pandoraea nosoerga]MBN4682817.1 cation:proton antiporter [Pandoraea nosoerga]MBN4745694.1 cation:proton antiporter [Pandoraea nosoerga]VVE05930.1 Na(+)/H(+)-K(+) antiporter GerN [Pandoraea nosoerga]